MAHDSSDDHGVVYGINDRPPLHESVSVGTEHILSMILGNIAPALIVAGALGLATGKTTYLVQMALIFAGLATIVQTYPIGPVGARLPIVMGTSFTFVGSMIAIGTQYGLAAIFGASIIAAFVSTFIGWKFKWFRSYFTPLVNGVIVVVIGLYLIPIGVDYLAGGAGAPDYGAPINLAVGVFTLLVAVLLNLLFSGFLRILSLLIALIAGYIVAILLGMVNFTPIVEAGWFAVPIPLKFGVAFEPIPILVFVLLFIITTMENIGHVSALTALNDRQPTEDEYSGALIADGIMSSLAGIFGAFPSVSFAQNVGVVSFTGVMSRFVVAIGGILLLILGFIPKIGAIFATIPNPVLGGVTLVMFGMILSNGLVIIKNSVPLNQRNMVIIAVSISAGLGVAFRPKILNQLPEQVQLFFGQALILAAITVLVLDILVPGTSGEDQVDRTVESTDQKTSTSEKTD